MTERVNGLKQNIYQCDISSYNISKHIIKYKFEIKLIIVSEYKSDVLAIIEITIFNFTNFFQKYIGKIDPVLYVLILY